MLFPVIKFFKACPACSRLRYFSIKHIEKENNVNETAEKLNRLITEIKEKILYNSVIESRLKQGYAANYTFMRKRKHYEEKMNRALQTIQPLPLCLKYYTENKSFEDNNEKKESEEEGFREKFNSNFPFISTEQVNEPEIKEKLETSIKKEVLARKQLLNADYKNWMTSYDNYEYDLVESQEINESDQDINYGTPDPSSSISRYPCGGCGAHLHCKDTAIPGYVPSEIFKNCFNPHGADAKSILCQRCYFLKVYNIALQVRVSVDDYPKILSTISANSSLIILMVDLTDFPCSIWPGIADILGLKVPIVVVGNKVDLLPVDSSKTLNRIRQVLYDNVKLCGFASANIKSVDLISAKTGYGVDNLITSLLRVYRYKGDVYLVGCTNVGKSSLFNSLLQSDFCKIQAADLIQRATTSVWPGTTLNLLKFPIMRISGLRSHLRHERLEQKKALAKMEKNLKRDGEVEKPNVSLMEKIERSFTRPVKDYSIVDGFSTQGNANASGKVSLGIKENHPDYVTSKWCFDTPGVVHPDQIIHMLTVEELLRTLPKDAIYPETFCVKPGTTLFIGGLARLDYVQGPNSVRLTVFRTEHLPVTICKMDMAENIYNELLGTDLFAVPINEGDRLSKWPGLSLVKTFRIQGKNIKESSFDVVLSSAGWVAINCDLKEYEFAAWTPEKRGVYVRDCILPKAVTLRGARIRDSVAYRKQNNTLKNNK
ncbi:nitric oxide-associated protein 1 [Sitophilus oryzae]|uniref:Nitric oxide-associated protein 1 n=1 Tax=Sitophilus oryzae TaxID=7048 RepID=A0A6J2YCW4_SITOR|nr:nitric oxide-associated protein 1 [Sitophilus oryzae]